MAIKPIFLPKPLPELPQNSDRGAVIKHLQLMRKQEEMLYRVMEEFFTQVRLMINQTGMNMEEVFAGTEKNFTTPDTPDEFSVSHNLGRIPVGRLVLSQDKPGSLHKGSSSWTSSAVYFQSDFAGVAYKILLF